MKNMKQILLLPGLNPGGRKDEKLKLIFTDPVLKTPITIGGIARRLRK